MSTGFWDLNSERDYYNNDINHGSYQYQTLNDLINTFLAFYVGENKIIPKASKEDVMFFARRAAQELSYDTLRSKKTWEVDVDSRMYVPLPHDFVGYTNVYLSSAGGIKKPLYPTQNTQNPFRAEIASDYVPPVFEEGQNLKSNTKVYVFYDGTSLGDAQAMAGYNAIQAWLASQEGFDSVQGENTFHTVVSNERWLDWAQMPMTGKFNNYNISAPFSPYNSAKTTYNDAISGIATPNNSAQNAVILASIAAGNQFYDDATGVYVGAFLTGDGTAGSAPSDTHVYKGLPPKASSSDDVLVIILADESANAYHHQGGQGGTIPNPDHNTSFNSDEWGNVLGGYHDIDSVGAQFDNLLHNGVTSIWKKDYEGFKINYSAHAANYRSFLYPSVQGSNPGVSGNARRAFALHSLAAISSGDKPAPDGTWTIAPACNIVNLSPIQDSNPYWNGLIPTWGGLDQYGWGINVGFAPFEASLFESDLTAFLGTEGLVTPDIEIPSTGDKWYDYNETELEIYGTIEDSKTTQNWKNTGGSLIAGDGQGEFGTRYGIEPSHAQVNGSYYMDYANGRLYFGSALIGSTVVLDYLSDGLDQGGDMVIHKFAEEAFYKTLAYYIVSTGAMYAPATIQQLKKEKFATTRNAKIRLSNIKSQEFTQIMRNKSKWIKS